MHNEVLNKQQLELLKLLKIFSKDFGLVGGTAIALHIGHRQSIDFDLFSTKPIKPEDIARKIKNNFKIERVLIDEKNEYTVIINRVKITFLYYPFNIKFNKKLLDIIRLPDLLTLAAMKSYALGRRAKWKDYVDLYFIMKNYCDINGIIKRAKQIFGTEFNEKMFRAQLSYFKDIDYTEKIIYMKGFLISDGIIKKELQKNSLEM
ncbi:MAG: nucleotidyl transferase AbiEii/AbiGii toxin family protein [bacterium]|nr:nucleotidyl transferase AbiEii/AbiGii toxin family protein [bacterium]